MVAPPRNRALLRLVVSLLVLPLLVTACGGDDEAALGPEGPVTSITITSPDLSFDIRAFEVPVGEPVTLTYENEHRGVAHNIRVDTGGADDPVTPLEVGVVTQELTFTIDQPGEYPYLCDVHPQMRGTVTAA